MTKIDIYTSSTCPYCTKAKKLLQMLGLNFTEHNVDNSFDTMCKDLEKEFNRPVATVPQIIINGKYVGGYSDLEALHKAGRLKEFLN